MHFEVAVSFLPSGRKLSVVVNPASARLPLSKWKHCVEAAHQEAFGEEEQVRVFERRSTSEVLSMDRTVSQELQIIRYVDAHTAYPPLCEIFKLPSSLTEAHVGMKSANAWKICASYFQLPNALAILLAAGHNAAAHELAEEALGVMRESANNGRRREAKGAHRAGLDRRSMASRAARHPESVITKGFHRKQDLWCRRDCCVVSTEETPREANSQAVTASLEGETVPVVRAETAGSPDNDFPANTTSMQKPDPARESTSDVQKNAVDEPCACQACSRSESRPPSEYPGGYTVPSPEPLALEDVHLVRESYVSSAWCLDGSTGELRPPAMLEKEGAQVPNPVSDLGACGCPAYHVRPDFVAFCLQHVRAQFPCDEPLVYVTLGSGALYHDWEVIEELLSHDYRVSEVHVVDTCYKLSLQEAEGCKHSRRASCALKALATWLATEGVTLRAYMDMEGLCASAAAAHVLMQCDADCPSQSLEPVLAPGGLHLHMSQATGEWLEAWRKPCVPSWFGKRRPLQSELSSRHALLRGLALLERRSGLDDVGVSCQGLARAQRRERALRAGELWCVVGEGFPEEGFLGCIGSCREPRPGSAVARFHAAGEELVLEQRSRTAEGWARLGPVQLDGPISGAAGWVPLGESGRFGRLVERVVEAAVTVTHAVEEGQAARVTVTSTATVLEVKEALAKKLRRPEVLRRARLVRRLEGGTSGGHLVSYKDGERLDGQRDVLLLGLDDLKHADGAGVSKLTRYKAWRIQKQRCDAFCQAAFQKRLQEFETVLGWTRDRRTDHEDTLKARANFILTAQLPVALRHGFENSREGVVNMITEVERFAGSDPEIRAWGPWVSTLLKSQWIAE